MDITLVAIIALIVAMIVLPALVGFSVWYPVPRCTACGRKQINHKCEKGGPGVRYHDGSF